ncbi:MAG: RNA polymerase sigma factor [bacterium]
MERSPTIETNDFTGFLEQCTGRDRGAWELFVSRYGRPMYAYIEKTLARYNYPLHSEVVEDIAHRTFLSLVERDCQSIRNFRGNDDRTFKAYLREICFHTTVDFLREQGRFTELDEGCPYSSASQKVDISEQNELREILSTIRDALPARHRYLFKLIYEEEWDWPEIAEALQISLNAAYQLKFRMIGNIVRIAKGMNLYDLLKPFAQPVCR